MMQTITGTIVAYNLPHVVDPIHTATAGDADRAEHTIRVYEGMRPPRHRAISNNLTGVVDTLKNRASASWKIDCCEYPVLQQETVLEASAVEEFAHNLAGVV